jgi:ATP synthase protein I
MSEHAPEPEDLRALGERIDALRRQDFPEPKAKAPSSGEVAIRFATELLAAVIVGAAIGFGLDKLFGTRWPFLTVLGFLLGAGAGIRNVIAASKDIERRTAEAAASQTKNEEQ